MFFKITWIMLYIKCHAKLKMKLNLIIPKL